jgi:hypothetical protein
MLSSPHDYLIIASVSVALFLRFVQCRIHREIALGQIHDSK